MKLEQERKAKKKVMAVFFALRPVVFHKIRLIIIKFFSSPFFLQFNFFLLFFSDSLAACLFEGR
jgi:hypothetical protein